MQEGWYVRGLNSLPSVARKQIEARYTGSPVDVVGLIDALDTLTSSASAQRMTEEFANLDRLGIDAAEREQYFDRAGITSEIPAQIGWFAAAAGAMFASGAGKFGSAPLQAVTLELGGTRQYGLWTLDDERTTKELDDVTWDLARDLREAFPNEQVTGYEYEGATPIKYRAFAIHQRNSSSPLVLGRRRRAVVDIHINGQVIQVIKQFRGIIPLLALGDDHRAKINDEFDLSRYTEDDDKPATFKSRAEQINRVTGTVMRTAILDKSYSEPLTVCPVDASLLMRAYRP